MHLAPLLETALERFRLNEEQARVLRRVAAWVDSPEESTTPPTLLVHGVFGAGKSHLLVSVLWYLQRALLGVTRGVMFCKGVVREASGVVRHGVVAWLPPHAADP